MHDFYFQIGEFAEICDVKKATLVHYAKIGLLPPHHIGENGYYYYTSSQIFEFAAISVLRSMSIPLAEAKTYLEDRNTESCRTVLQKKLEKVQEQRRNLEYVEAIVQNTLQELEHAKSQVLDVIEVITLEKPVRYFVYDMPYRTEQYIYKIKNIYAVINCCKENLSNNSINVIEVVLHRDVENGSFAKTYGGFRAHEDAVISEEHLAYRPAGTYLTMCSRSGGDRIVDVYRTLKRYAEMHCYKIVGNAYEEDVLNYIIEHDRKHYLVRCYLQVESSIR